MATSIKHTIQWYKCKHFLIKGCSTFVPTRWKLEHPVSFETFNFFLLKMKVSRIILVTLFLFSLVVVPTNSKKSKKSKKPKKIDFDLDYGFGSGLTVDDQEQKLVDDEKQNPKTGFDKGHLKQGFYSESCPTAEKIVADALVEITKTNPNAIANIIRLQFHDCFVVVSISKFQQSLSFFNMRILFSSIS